MPLEKNSDYGCISFLCPQLEGFEKPAKAPLCSVIDRLDLGEEDAPSSLPIDCGALRRSERKVRIRIPAERLASSHVSLCVSWPKPTSSLSIRSRAHDSGSHESKSGDNPVIAKILRIEQLQLRVKGLRTRQVPDESLGCLLRVQILPPPPKAVWRT